jgi:hypothetical protein
LTDTQLRATAVPVSGPLTDTQLRASAVPVSGPLTDTQLRTNPVSITDKNFNEAPKTCTVVTVVKNTIHAAIPVPAGATGVRLYAVTKNVTFRTDTDPSAYVAGTFGNGGMAIAGQVRVYRFPAAVADLRLGSTEGGAGVDTDVVVEFFGV